MKTFLMNTALLVVAGSCMIFSGAAPSFARGEVQVMSCRASIPSVRFNDAIAVKVDEVKKGDRLIVVATVEHETIEGNRMIGRYIVQKEEQQENPLRLTAPEFDLIVDTHVMQIPGTPFRGHLTVDAPEGRISEDMSCVFTRALF